MIELAFYAVIAIFIFSRLYSSLGKVSVSDLFYNNSTENTPNEDENVVDSNALEIAVADAQIISSMDSDLANDASVVLNRAKLIDTLFSLKEFLDGAQSAFEMIIKGLRKGDIDSFRDFVSSEILQKMEAEIEKLNSLEKRLFTEFVKIDFPSIHKIKIDASIVEIEIHVSSQQINFAKNKEDVVIEGSTSKIQKIKDLWCFSGDLLCTNNRWKLVSTQKTSKS